MLISVNIPPTHTVEQRQKSEQKDIVLQSDQEVSASRQSASSPTTHCVSVSQQVCVSVGCLC